MDVGRREIMEVNRAEQKEALETLAEFNERLLKNMGIVIKELSGERLDDTDKFLDSIINAINWEIQVMNGTMSLLNEGTERINKQTFNQKMLALGAGIKEKEDGKIAEALKELMPEFENLGSVAKEIIA